ncbi:superoxide reductase [Methanocalculus alkaliphilus]|uniref:desulfoferrodoxin n=1 Tax=Methanocalculus alkaliphilus TaxID=768730 RepID=UPI0020A132AC|nr:desulfoferrodoxin [Methanocalculus alkaliphilus]MCP1714891.1 superoxide reductase [Methanocalculus alkaliphilus]
MTNIHEIYKCGVCGNITGVMHSGNGKLVCCGKEMELLSEQTADKTNEKHVPIIERSGKGYLVTVGSTPHPMEENHYVEWIELQTKEGIHRAYLTPGMAPAAYFETDEEPVKAREYCNIHLLWADR